MHLVPAMIGLTKGDILVVIDELDRSLHPEILHSYVANFLKYFDRTRQSTMSPPTIQRCSNSHFFAATRCGLSRKGTDQSSRLVGLEEYQERKRRVKDLQQDYLQGRFGGVPVIRDFSWLGENDGKGA